MFRFEKIRCMRGKGTKTVLFLTGLLVLGHFLGFCIWYVGMEKGGVISSDNQYLLDHGLDSMYVYPETLYEGFIGGECYTFFNQLYYYMIPILAVLPFGASFLQDEESGYLKYIYTKQKKIRYLVCKYVITFLSGGIAVALPYIGSFLLNATYLPAVIPNQIAQHSSIIDAMSLSEYYYSKPWIFYGAYLLGIMLAGGFLGVTALIVSFFVRNYLFVLCFPFLLYLSWDYIAAECNRNSYSIHYLLNPLHHEAGVYIGISTVYGIFIGLNIVAAVLFLNIGRYREKIL